MRSALSAALIALLALPAAAAEPAKPQPAQKPAPQQRPPQGPGASMPKPMTPAETERTLYAVGLAVSNSLEVFGLTQAELETVVQGIRDGWAGKPRFQLDAKAQSAVNDLARSRAPRSQERAASREKEVGGPYLAKMAKEKGAVKTQSGAIVIPLQQGTGASPTASDKVKVHYTGTLVSGRVFDTSAQRGPAEFPLGGVIKCWTEALQRMKVGGKAKIVCPPEIAYGANGTGGIPGNAVLTFEVELLEVVK